MIEVVSDWSGVHNGDQQQVEPHAKVGHGQVAHKELGHRQPEPTAKQHKQHCHIAQQSGHSYDPHGHAQRPVSHQVLARVERIWHGVTLDF